MKRSAALFAFCAVLAQLSIAATKVDSILSFTGNRHVKFIWNRWPWCNADYSPNTTVMNVKDNYFEDITNEHVNTQIVLFDTRVGHEQYVDSALGYHWCPRITRKGTYVVWTDWANKCSWIRPLPIDPSKPKTKLINGGDFIVVACRYDAVKDSEYVYVCSPGGDAMAPWDLPNTYCIPFKADYTLDLTRKVLIFAAPIMNSFSSVSSNGRYIGGCYNNDDQGLMVYDVVKKASLYRHNQDSYDGGCQPCLSPDTSGRYFFMVMPHTFVVMDQPVAKYASFAQSAWELYLNANLPVQGSASSSSFDVCQPRWTNDTAFLTASFPYEYGYMDYGQTCQLMGKTAATIKTMDPNPAGSFCLGKFSADYRSVQKYIRISDGDIRHRDATGDAWLEGVATQVSKSNPRVSTDLKPARSAAVIRGNMLEVSFAAGQSGSVQVVTTAGKVVAGASGTGRAICSLGAHPAGTYIVRTRLADGAGAATVQVSR